MNYREILNQMFISAILMVMMISIGCTSKSSSPTDPGSVSDEDAIRNLINSEYMTLLSEATHYSQPDTGGKSSCFSPILPVHWYRHPLDGFQKDIIVQINGDTAYTTVSFTGMGDFKIFFFKQTQIDSVIKNFIDDFTREAMFVRVQDANSAYNGWRLRGIKPGKIATPGGNHYIDSLIIQTSDTTYHVNNFDIFYNIHDDSLNGLMTLNQGENIAITMYTHGDSVDAFVHISWKDYHRRSLLMPDTLNPGVFSRNDIILDANMPEHVHLAFDIIDFNTLHDDSAAYYSAAYIIPFNVSYPDY